MQFCRIMSRWKYHCSSYFPCSEPCSLPSLFCSPFSMWAEAAMDSLCGNVWVCVFLISSLSPCCFRNGSSRPLHTLSFLVLIEHVVLLNYSNWCQQMKNVCLSPPSTLPPPPQPRHLWRAIMLTMVKLNCVCHCLIKSKKKKRERRPSLDGLLAKWNFKSGTLAGSVHKHAPSFLHYQSG